jgi:hypothetical protein
MKHLGLNGLGWQKKNRQGWVSHWRLRNAALKPEDLASYRSLPKAEQNAVDASGIGQWAAWEQRNAASILDGGGMVGKTTRITRDGVTDAVNPFCGYLVIEAETADAAARLFQDHPTLPSFPATAWISCPF